MRQGVTLYPQNVISFIDRIRPNIAAGRRWNYHGLHKNDFISTRIGLVMKGQTRIWTGMTWERERFSETMFNGLQRYFGYVSSNFSEHASLSLETAVGRDIARFLKVPALGNSMEVSINGSWRPNHHLFIQPVLNYSRLRNRTTGTNYFSGYIARVRVKYQFTRSFFFRTVVQYNNFLSALEIHPLLTYKLNAFTAIYLGSTHDLDQFARGHAGASTYFQETSRQIFFKVQYLVRT